MRERGNIWPVICVIAVALLVVILPFLIRHRQASGRMATVDAQVSIADVRNDPASSREPPAYRWPDSEVPRTAERLRDVTAVAIAASTYVAEGAMTDRTPHDAREIALGIAKRQLIPQEWLTNQSGVLQTAHGTLHVRYSPNDLSVEVVSVPSGRSDGPAMLIRIPDNENTSVGSRYFESMQLDGIAYPAPFAPIPDIIRAGWRARIFKQPQLASQEGR
ncbi:MAG: hypothetical protein QOG23_2838 [Blastocatellia bacterium]|jgi:hypothetical protein|nr:hypothetical protein [Blastocatellia bacterium]